MGPAGKEWQPFSFAHPLLVTRASVYFAQGIQRAPELDLLVFYPENKFVYFVTFFDGNEDVTLPIKPDGFFVVKDLSTAEMLVLFPEDERLTAPLKRSTFKQSAFYKKVLVFLHYYRHLEQLRERLEMPIDDFIVPVVCENPERKEALRKRLYKLGPEHPQLLLYGEVWTTAAGEQGSILHPQVVKRM